jgi:uncharacterized membrane protein
VTRRSRKTGSRRAAPVKTAKAASGRVPPAQTDDSPQRRRWAPWFVLVAAYAGFVISLYLTFVHYRGYVSPCYVVHGCEEVQTSEYSAVLGIPVALIGTVFFGLLFYLGIGVLAKGGKTLVNAFKVVAFAGALAVIPLFLLQALVLKAFCSYCVATEIVMISIWIASFFIGAARESAEAAPAT